MPAFEPAPAVNRTSPATSSNASGEPAVATGTVSVTFTDAFPRAGTVTVDASNDTECGRPWSSVSETANVAGELPKLRSLTFIVFWKSRFSSEKPKLSVAVCWLPRATTFVTTARWAWTKPAPAPRVVYPATRDGSAVLTIAAFQKREICRSPWSSSSSRPRASPPWPHEACAWRTSAATPVVCGAAIEVPERTVAWLPVPFATDEMLTPGAVTSGFRKLSSERAPNDVKLASALNVGFASVAFVSVTVFPSAASHAAAVDDGVPRNGIVTVNFAPLSGFSVILPSNGGNAF